MRGRCPGSSVEGASSAQPWRRRGAQRVGPESPHRQQTSPCGRRRPCRTVGGDSPGLGLSRLPCPARPHDRQRGVRAGASEWSVSRVLLSHIRLRSPMGRNTPGPSVLHCFLEFAQPVMLSSPLILCHPLLLLSSVFPSIRVFSNELALCIR